MANRKRVVPKMYEMCGMHQAVSDVYTSKFFDTEKEAREDHRKMIGKIRKKGMLW